VNGPPTSAFPAVSSFWRVAGGLLLAVSAWFGGSASAADPLGRFPADASQVSVAGISSGAFMANQLHIAHSAGIMGAGIVAGGLFGCAVDSVTGDGVLSLASLAVGPCMSTPALLQPVSFYARIVTDLAAKGWIDPPGNLVRSRVYLFTGQADKVVNSKTVELGAGLYRTLGVPSAQIDFRDRDLPGTGAGHSWVTNNFGNACDANATPFINNCHYDQAGEMLQTVYGPLQPPAVRPEGRIVPFDQTEFVPRAAAAANGLADTGYLYVPRACEAGAQQPCRVAVVLHACLQSAEVLGSEFHTKVGVNEWADTNRIIVLYPQAHATTVSELSSQNSLSLLNTNPQGCWNWWGYAGDTQYLTKQGVQVGAIWSMVRRVTAQGN
jgi:poly(3-hydroxybutyrate) depolymerase